jgi:hypothetical protein
MIRASLPEKSATVPEYNSPPFGKNKNKLNFEIYVGIAGFLSMTVV